MRRFLKRLMLTAAAVLAAAVVFVTLTLPPSALDIAAPESEHRLVWGAYHVHSSNSDGSGSIDEIAAAASRAGLQFVIFTDHGDATTFEAPSYRSGVLCIHAPEINTESGHVVALGLQAASPFPLAGEARDVVDDIRRMGGAAIAAHPESPRQNLRWRGQPGAVDGYEWFNADAEWRQRTAWEIAGAGLRSAVRSPESLAALFRAARIPSRWDRRAAGSSPLFSLAALDAHARAGADAHGETSAASIRIPSYDTMFRTIAQVVRLGSPLTGDPAADGLAVTNGIRERKSYAITRAFANARVPLLFDITESGRASGEVNGLEGVELRLFRNGEPVVTASGRLDSDAAGAPGDYRLEAWIKGRAFPWIVSDGVRVQRSPHTPDSGGLRAGATAQAKPAAAAATVAIWQIEKHSESTATLATDPGGAVLSYRLGAGIPAGQYVALSAPAGAEPVASIRFTGSSREPMRVSVQVRISGGADGQRWRRSIYLDRTPREVVVDLADMQPVDRRTTLRPIVARVQSVLLVIDTVNARPGAAGELAIRDARLVHGRPDATSGR